MYLVAPQTVRPEQRSYTSYHVIDSSSATRVVLETSNPASWTFRGFSWTDRQFYATRIAQMGVICASIPLCSCLIMDLPVPEATLHLILMFRLDEWMPFEKPRRSFQLSLTKKLDVPSLPGPCNGRNLSVGYAMFHKLELAGASRHNDWTEQNTAETTEVLRIRAAIFILSDYFISTWPSLICP